MTHIPKTRDIYSYHGRRCGYLEKTSSVEIMLQTGYSLSAAVCCFRVPKEHEFRLYRLRETPIIVFFKQTYQVPFNHLLSAAGTEFPAVGLRAWTSSSTYTEGKVHLLTVPTSRSSTNDQRTTAKKHKTAAPVKLSVKRWRVEHSYELEQHEATSELISDVANLELLDVARVPVTFGQVERMSQPIE